MSTDAYNTFQNVQFNYEFIYDNPDSTQKKTALKWYYGDVVSLLFDLRNRDFNYKLFVATDNEAQQVLDQVMPPINATSTPEFIINNFLEYSWIDDKTVKVAFYNYRYEEVYAQIFEPSDFILNGNYRELIVFIDDITSKAIFKRGLYFCGVTILDGFVNGQSTIVAPQNYLIEVV